MALTKENFIKEIEGMTVLELNELVEALKEKFNVSGAPVMAAGGQAPEAAQEEKTAFNVVLKEVGSSKIAVIKEVKALLGVGLKEAKEITEGVGKPIKEKVDKATAEDMKKKLEAAGASVELQ